MKNYKRPGKSIAAVATAPVASGDLVVIGALVGVASTSAAAGETFEAALEGVFEVPKTSAQAWTIGAKVYLTSGGEVTTVASGNTAMGHAFAAAADPSAKGLVRLSN